MRRHRTTRAPGWNDLRSRGCPDPDRAVVYVRRSEGSSPAPARKVAVQDSLDPDTAPACYCCGERVVGRG